MTGKNGFKNAFDQLKKEYLDSFPDKLKHLEKLISNLTENPRDENSLKDLLNSVHKIRGSAGSYGFKNVMGAASEWENMLKPIVNIHQQVNPSELTSMNEHLDKIRKNISIDWNNTG